MDIHIRLSKKTPGDARSSTRTFLLYLEGCGRGRLLLLSRRLSPLSSALSSSLVGSLLLSRRLSPPTASLGSLLREALC